MRRICLPETYIKLYRNIYNNRTNRVITAFGLTDTYKVEDGLDQGRVESTLHWRIFYDPLLCEIQQLQQHGYESTVSWKADLMEKKELREKCTISVAAYVDDTSWIARGKQQMQNFLNTAMEFFNINDVEINPKKTKVIAINASSQNRNTPLLFGSPTTELQVAQKEEGVRVLGVWFSEDGKLKNHMQVMRNRVNNIVETIKDK